MNLKNSPLLLIIPLFFIAAADIRISGSNHAEYWVFVDKELDTSNYKEHLEDKLKLSVNYGDITLKGVLFLWSPSLSVQEKLNYLDYAAIYSKDAVNILYGTYYTTFGRGLALNAFLDEDFRIDNSLYGVKVDFKYLGSQLTLLSGEPRCIFFEENKYKIKNEEHTSDQIRGINFNTKLIPKTTLGSRYVRINQTTDLTPKAFTELFGGDIDFTIGPFDAYFEYARQWGSDDVIGGRVRGDGILFTTSFATPGLGISCQFMDYNDIGFGNPGYRYNEPPTPIKSGISVNRGLDEVGYGVSFIVSPLDFLTLELDHNKISTHDETVNKFKEIATISDNMDGVLEHVAKMTIYTTYDLEINGGVERVLKQGIELPIEKKIETKPNIELTYNFGSFFIETGYEHNFISSDTSDYYDHAAFFSIGKPELFVFTLRYERRNRIPEWLVEKYGDETAWPLAELSLDLTHRHNLRIRVGAEKGGLICSGGVCRFEEPLRGVKAVLTSIF
ncbi:hypothetical protein AMJ52_04925 [candidate division TA06 bacterium DG_78]|uniref:Uncharacterized protein n=1 Tax=candidate division TA06 bacterium DG_78 TaxID=1703772 RepID=A0A0S7YEF2_UNCT6|nr:MAG: hypothetical protein AMJ52_04925 [candidate division TA06 bacterium DG_78]